MSTVHNLLELSEDELFERLGYWYGRSPSDQEVLRSASSEPEIDRIKGQHLFQRALPAVQQKVCVEWNACSKLDRRTFTNKVDLAAAVSDCLAGLMLGLPVSILCVLVVKLGLDGICDCEKPAAGG